MNSSSVAAFDEFLAPQCTAAFMDRFVIRRAILEAVKAAAPLMTGTVLDVGCGVMPYRDVICSLGARVEQYIGVDMFNDADQARCNAQVDLRWDGKVIPLETQSIHSAVCTEVLEHCENPALTLAEIVRVLKPDGMIFLTVPFIWPLHENPNDRARFTSFALRDLLLGAGFEHIDIKAMAGWNGALAQMIGLWLRRAPMPEEQRAELEGGLFQFYQHLLNTDAPLDPFAWNTITPGWTATARKGAE